jgi:hypothetical protein
VGWAGCGRSPGHVQLAENSPVWGMGKGPGGSQNWGGSGLTKKAPSSSLLQGLPILLSPSKLQLKSKCTINSKRCLAVVHSVHLQPALFISRFAVLGFIFIGGHAASDRTNRI